MNKISNKKAFDAVSSMREIRNQISLDTQGMTLEELKRYIQLKMLESNTKPVGKQQ